MCVYVYIYSPLYIYMYIYIYSPLPHFLHDLFKCYLPNEMFSDHLSAAFPLPSLFFPITSSPYDTTQFASSFCLMLLSLQYRYGVCWNNAVKPIRCDP